MRLSQEISESFPSSQIVFGGPHATLNPQSILQYSPHGAVIIGDGEVPFTEIAHGKKIDSIPGVYSQNNSSRSNSLKTSIVRDLDSLPWIDRKFTPNEPFTKDEKLARIFLSSRGCTGNCTFCITSLQSDDRSRIRFRDMENVIQEVSSLKDTFDIAHFIDDDMLPSHAHARQFIKLWTQTQYDLNNNKEFRCLMRPDQIVKHDRRGILRELASIGLKKVSLGIETGHPRGRNMLSASKKDPKYTEAVQIAAIAACKRTGISANGFFMIGLPGETRAEIEQTLRYIQKLGSLGMNSVRISPFKAYPHTKLWNKALNMGFSSTELGHYDSPNIKSLIESSTDITDDRIRLTQNVQLSAIPNDELAEICHNTVTNFKKEFGNRE